MERFRRNVLTGLLTVIPLWITAWVVWFILDLLVWFGRPFVPALTSSLRPLSPEFADLLAAQWFQSLIALILVTAFLYVLGATANAVVGRRLIRLIDGIIERVPIVKTIYGATRTLITSFREGPNGGQRVVLIEFPHKGMRAVGFVTATFQALDTGEDLAAVYVPTTPNPTSGYLEIVPMDRLVWLDWTPNEAMAFIVSGGSLAPSDVRMRPGPPISPVPPVREAPGRPSAALAAAREEAGPGGG